MAEATESRSSPGPRVGGRLARSLLAPSGVPYAGALAGGFVSAVLTYRYVGAGAHELNPVMRALIATVGLRSALLFKVALLVAAYWVYAWLRAELPARTVAAAAWIGALVHLADAAHDLRVALRAPFAPPIAVADGALFVCVAAAAVLLWPRWHVLRRLVALHGRVR